VPAKLQAIVRALERHRADTNVVMYACGVIANLGTREGYRHSSARAEVWRTV
jgi:hypothetical protein